MGDVLLISVRHIYFIDRPGCIFVQAGPFVGPAVARIEGDRVPESSAVLVELDCYGSGTIRVVAVIPHLADGYRDRVVRRVNGLVLLICDRPLIAIVGDVLLISIRHIYFIDRPGCIFVQAGPFVGPAVARIEGDRVPESSAVLVELNGYGSGTIHVVAVIPHLADGYRDRVVRRRGLGRVGECRGAVVGLSVLFVGNGRLIFITVARNRDCHLIRCGIIIDVRIRPRLLGHIVDVGTRSGEGKG